MPEAFRILLAFALGVLLASMVIFIGHNDRLDQIGKTIKTSVDNELAVFRSDAIKGMEMNRIDACPLPEKTEVLHFAERMEEKIEKSLNTIVETTTNTGKTLEAQKEAFERCDAQMRQNNSKIRRMVADVGTISDGMTTILKDLELSYPCDSEDQACIDGRARLARWLEGRVAKLGKDLGELNESWSLDAPESSPIRTLRTEINACVSNLDRADKQLDAQFALFESLSTRLDQAGQRATQGDCASVGGAGFEVVRGEKAVTVRFRPTNDTACSAFGVMLLVGEETGLSEQVGLFVTAQRDGPETDGCKADFEIGSGGRGATTADIATGTFFQGSVFVKSEEHFFSETVRQR